MKKVNHQAERDSITTLSWQRYTFLVRPVMWVFVCREVQIFIG